MRRKLSFKLIKDIIWNVKGTIEKETKKDRIPSEVYEMIFKSLNAPYTRIIQNNEVLISNRTMSEENLSKLKDSKLVNFIRLNILDYEVEIYQLNAPWEIVGAIFDKTPCYITIEDNNGKIIYVNKDINPDNIKDLAANHSANYDITKETIGEYTYTVYRPQSYIDHRTGLLNRNGFDMEYLVMRHKTNAYYIYIDIDNFKGINDNYGHQVGDLAISHISENLKKLAERLNAVAGRWGGDEFVIGIPSNIPFDIILNTINEFRETLKDCLYIGNELIPINMTLSAVLDTGTDNLDDIFKIIDDVLREAKEKNEEKGKFLFTHHLKNQHGHYTTNTIDLDLDKEPKIER